VRVSAKVDYAVRAAIELAASDGDGLVKAEAIASAQGIPRKFLDNILQQMRQAGIVESRRGPDGGHRLARDADDVTVADVIRAIDGPLANVGGRSPDAVDFPGPAARLREVWVALRVSIREVLEEVTLADIVAGELPDAVTDRLGAPGAWQRR
jgi:Rrf2 family protein